MEDHGIPFLTKLRKIVRAVLGVAGVTFIVCCGGAEEKPVYLTGRFIDGPVSGLNFKTESVSGQTDANGLFKCRKGEDITFLIGNIVLGTTKAKPLISPVDLVPGATDASDPAVINMAMFLQTFDHDGQINNGIQIPAGIEPVIADVLKSSGEIDFSQSPENFIADRTVNLLLEELNTIKIFAENSAGSVRRMIPGKDAGTHLQAFFSQRIEAQTTHGKVRGFALKDGCWAFLGIPYAKPPLGGLRWRSPESPEPWKGILDATSHCQPCVQQIHSNSWQPTSKYIGSEDCLYLDVYRPKTNAVDLPVYVWIHGGINNFGAAREHDGSVLAQQGNMIVVVVQYRLGALGWFTHPVLRKTEDKLDASGNYGMLDQLKALEWVKENIAAFGGNPGNVTVGGQSGGAHNVLNLIMSPAANGLFHKAVIQSASMELRTFNQGDVQADTMIDWMLVDDETTANSDKAASFRAKMTHEGLKDYLHSKAASKILDACRLGVGNGIVPPHSAFIDGTLLKAGGWPQTIAAGNYNKMPVLIGNNRFEFKNILPLYGEILNNRFPAIPSGDYTWGDIYLVLDGNLPLDAVFPSKRDKDFFHAVAQLLTRLGKATYVDAIARAFKAKDARTPVYAYRFDWSGGGDSALTDYDFLIGASHGTEIPFFFGNNEDPLGYAFTQSNKVGRVALQKAMITYLSNFAATGNPNPQKSPLLEWPQWSNTKNDPKVITLDAGLSNLQLSVSSQEEELAAVFADIMKARTIFNNTSELGYMDFLELSLPDR